MIRNSSFRRLVIAATLFMGLFAQFQTVFACEFKDGKLQPVCCCDDLSGKSGDMTKDCAEGDSCDNPQATPTSDNTTCCDVSYQQVPGATAISPTQHSQQVLLLDAPQPPPLLPSFNFNTSQASSQPVIFSGNTPTRVTGTQTYLLTQRFRI